MQFDIITIFPEIFDSYFKESIIKRALKKGLIKVNIHNLRDWTKDSHKTVDDRPYGGGIGMVMKVEPIFKAVTALKKLRNPPSLKLRRASKNKKTKIVLFTPRGKKFNQKMAYQFSNLDQLMFICGRYEGVDERVAKYIADTELSIGDYDLMGGELPAMVVIETVARLIPGVLGKPELLKERITKEKGFIEYPQYTRPEVFSPRLCRSVAKAMERRRQCFGLRPTKSPSADEVGGQAKKGTKWAVPKVLLSGDHKKIEEWRKKHRKIISS